MSYNPHNTLMVFFVAENAIVKRQELTSLAYSDMRQSQDLNLYLYYNKLICVMSA